VVIDRRYKTVPQTLTQIGKYRIERELGRGAMGVVYKAFDPVVERMIAIKTIRLDVEDAEELVKRLRREAKSVGQLEHPNIVTLYDAGETGGLFYLAMQFIQGETLQDRLTRQRWFALKEVQELFRQICAGLDYAHQRGVIHRDIKPANIMITNDGTVKLTDFGIAKMAGAGTTSAGLIVGTPSYMSPEQALGRPLDGRSDIFSLGCILYELVTGEKAFPGQNVTTVMYKIVHEAPTPLAALQPGVDPAVEALVLKALAKNPDERFQSCSELSTALELYLTKAHASMPKTSVAGDVPAPPPKAAVPQPLPTPAASQQVVPPASSVAIPPAASSASVPMVAQAGLPLAWLGGGVLGTLLLMVIILLVMQMRRPSTPPQPAPASANTSQPVTPSPSSSTATQPQVSNPASVPPISASAQESKPPAVPRQTARVPQQPTKERTTRPASPVPPTTARAQPQVSAPISPAPAAPETFESLIVKGDIAFQGSHYQDALDAYSRAYRLNPNSREVRRKLATVLTLLGRGDEARKYQ
jgi:serine/threonine-protein kinase